MRLSIGMSLNDVILHGGTAGVPIPDTPTGLAVSGETYNSVDLDWDAMDGASGYYIYQDDVKIDDVADNSTYTVASLASLTSFTFQVSAYNDSGESDLCTGVVGTTLSGLSNGLVSYWKLDGGTA